MTQSLENRIAQLERAFIAYVTDDHLGHPVDPPVLGLCANCGFPVYENNGLWHYSRQGVASKPIVCDRASFTTPQEPRQ